MNSYRPQIVLSATKHNLDPDLVDALVQKESSGLFYAYRYEPGFFRDYLASNPTYRDRNPYEVSASFGLCQVMYTTALEHGFVGDPWDLFNPVKNLEIGCTILASLLTWARTLVPGSSSNEQIAMRRLALGAYNGGKGNARKPVPVQYALSVLGIYDRIRRASGA